MRHYFSFAKLMVLMYHACMKRRVTDIEDALRRAVRQDERSRYELARLSGVSQAQLSLFVNRKRTLTLNTAAKLAKVLGLELRPTKKGG